MLLWSIPVLDDELLSSLKNEGQIEVCTTLAGKIQSAGDVKVRVHQHTVSLIVEKVLSKQTEFGIKCFGVIRYPHSQELPDSFCTCPITSSTNLDNVK